ncbi:hypothetical protein DVH24_029039 [Malus domestica]|uniref:Uncharacterized protein n=1 Tax=Malus domestica TaxID=3750 RepID=A0A498HRZ1_MALDO|nr:hypothetical protein DVH24_029039 [Malus domestica]
MSSAGVAGMMFRCVFEGSLSMQDTEIERRPYHKNCSCALHSKAAFAPMLVKETFPFLRISHGLMAACACKFLQHPNVLLL